MDANYRLNKSIIDLYSHSNKKYSQIAPQLAQMFLPKIIEKVLSQMTDSDWEQIIDESGDQLQGIAINEVGTENAGEIPIAGSGDGMLEESNPQENQMIKIRNFVLQNKDSLKETMLGMIK